MPPDLGATPPGVSCTPRSRHLEKVEVTVTQSCPTLCDPMDYSPPQSSVHGWRGFQHLQNISKLLLCVSINGEPEPFPKATLDKFVSPWSLFIN